MENQLVRRILKIPRPAKRIIALALDIAVCLLTVALAYLLRLDQLFLPVGNQWLSYAAALALAIPLFITFGLYRAIFRYAGWGALNAIIRACGIYGFMYGTIFTLISLPGVPRSIGLIQPLLLFLFVCSSRAAVRYFLGGHYQSLLKKKLKRNVMIYGAGSAGRQLAAALSGDSTMQVVGFIDDDPTLQGSSLNGLRIHQPQNLMRWVEEKAVDDILLAVPSASRKRRNQIIDLVKKTTANIRTLPGVTDLAQGKVTVNDLRELEIEDLLGREAVPPNHLLLQKNITEKTVLVSGAGGSIGSELCRLIASLEPTRLLLVEVSEIALYDIHQELLRRQRLQGSKIEIIPLLANVGDKVRMRSILQAWAPHTVYHAAAYKHVPLVEHNPAAGVQNNVLGTKVFASLARKMGVANFVLISTDKAVRPTNVMGTTKRLAEQVLQAMAAEDSKTIFSMVRFGNVLGSSGSVVPLFRQQISTGGPVTITHKDITRYFMTIPEAAQLVVQAGAMAKGGEVFVLDMGEPVKIMDLARRMIELSGLTVLDDENPDGDIEIETIGLRPGEKLYEELLIGDDPAETSHPRIMMARDSFLPWAELSVELDAVKEAITQENVLEIRAILERTVPEFEAKDDVVDWVHIASGQN